MTRAAWTKVHADTSIQRSSQTLSVLAKNAFIYGGELRPREPVDSAMYRVSIISGADSCNEVCRRIDSMSIAPQPRVGAASTTIDRKVYVFSGRGGTAMTPIEEAGSFWVFEPSGSSWSQVRPADPLRPYPVGRSYHAVTNDGKDTIFLHAGCSERGRLCDLWAFNILTRQWQELPPAPKPERGGTSIAYADEKLFRMHGFDGEKEQGGALDVFDPGNNVWNTITYPADGISGPVPRSVSCLLSVKVSEKLCLITMFGEHYPSSLGHQGAGNMLSDLWIFNIESHKWTEIHVDAKSAPLARGWFDADVVTNSLHPSVVVHGGLAGSNDRLGDIWRLDL